MSMLIKTNQQLIQEAKEDQTLFIYRKICGSLGVNETNEIFKTIGMTAIVSKAAARSKTNTGFIHHSLNADAHQDVEDLLDLTLGSNTMSEDDHDMPFGVSIYSDESEPTSSYSGGGGDFSGGGSSGDF